MDEEVHEQLLNSKVSKEDELLLRQNLYDIGISSVQALGESYCALLG